MVKVAVLGHRGMLGSRVVAALAPRHHVITFGHRWPDWLGPAIEAARPDWVIHCARTWDPDADVTFTADIARRLRGRVIYPSSDAVGEPTGYGAAKAEEEDEVLRQDGTAIRCGIVDPDGGLLARVRAADIFRADTRPHWNGITALAWAGVAERVITDDLSGLVVPGSPPTSIHDLAVEACHAFGWRTEVVMRATEGPDRVQRPTLWMPPIRDQLAAYR